MGMAVAVSLAALCAPPCHGCTLPFHDTSRACSLAAGPASQPSAPADGHGCRVRIMPAVVAPSARVPLLTKWPESDGLLQASPGLPAWHGGSGAGWPPVLYWQPLVPTGTLSLSELFSIKAFSAGAPLRNRTVDLLLTVHAGSVGWRRVGSDYRWSEGLACLGSSGSVCHCLRPL